MKSIIDIGKDIVYEIKETSNPKLLFDLFEVRTRYWEYPIISCECGTFGIFDDLNILNSIQGFELIPTAVEIINNQTRENLLTIALSLLLTCVEVSNTTEMPAKLAQCWTDINSRVSESNNEEGKKIWIHM